MAGRYKILEELGKGGSGAVFKAYDTQLDRYVAIKRLIMEDDAVRQDLQNDGGLKKEAASLATLQHPNIVAVYDLGSDDEGYFMVMELVEGETLAEWIKGSPMTLDDFQELATQTLEAMLTAHSQSILHRDLKPENIKLKRLPGGRLQVKVLDFGLARMSYAAKKMTEDQRGHVAGSIHFMAPEQLQRKPIDGRTDLYSLGCVFYQALSGRRPYDDTTVKGVIEAHLQHMVYPLKTVAPEVPQPICDWVMWMINADPIHRPASAEHAIASLRDIAAAGWFGRASEAVPLATAIPVAEPANRPHTGAVRPPSGAVPGAALHARPPSGAVSQRISGAVPQRPTGMVPRRPTGATPRPPTGALRTPAGYVSSTPSAPVKTGLPGWIWPVIAAVALGATWFLWPKGSPTSASTVVATSAPSGPALLPPPPGDFLQGGHVLHYRAGQKTEAWSGSGQSGRDAKPNEQVLTWHDLSGMAGDGALTSFERLQQTCPKFLIEKPGGLKGSVGLLRFAPGQGLFHRMDKNDGRRKDYPFGDPAKSKGVTVIMLVRPDCSKSPVRCFQLRDQDNKGRIQVRAHPNNEWKLVVQAGTSTKEVKVGGRDTRQFSLVGVTWNLETNKALLSVRGEDGNKARAEGDAPKEDRGVLNELRIADFSKDAAKPTAPEDTFAGDVVELVVWPFAMDWNARSTQEMKFMKHYFNKPGTQF